MIALFPDETPRKRITRRLGELKNARASWEPHWREIGENLLPRRLRLDPDGEFQRGDKLNSKIYDSHPLVAARRFAAGMMAGATNPSQPWFRLTTRDPDMADYGPVKAYLYQVQVRLQWAFAKSNFYQALCDGVYPDLLFGTAVMIIDAHPTKILHCQSLPVGEAYLAVNGENQVDTCYRDLVMTVRQVVNAFCRDGNLSRLSPSVRNAYSKKDYEQKVRVVHAIEPNSDFEADRIGPDGFEYSSTWVEKDVGEERYLKRGGYEMFPVLAPRWSVLGTDVYGRGPGMDCLADCKQLQHETGAKAQLIDLTRKPPMKGSASLRGSVTTMIPGETTWLPDGGRDAIWEPAIRVDHGAIGETRADIDGLKNAIDRELFVDLWMSLLNDDRKQPKTATEIMETRQERMLQLGPAIQRLTPELLAPSIERAFQIMGSMGLLPDNPPPEIQGEELQVEFISLLHQAQKATGLSAIQTLWGMAQQIAQSKPAVMDKMEADATMDEIAEIVGVKPTLVLSAEDVAKVRAVRAKQEQAAQQAQQAMAAAKGASMLGNTPAPAPDNALGALLGQNSQSVVPGSLPA